MRLEHLSDVHTREDTKRIEDDIYRIALFIKRHILDRNDTRDDTLVSVASRHLVTDLDLASLRDVDFYLLEYSSWEIVPVFTTKDVYADDFSSRS